MAARALLFVGLLAWLSCGSAAAEPWLGWGNDGAAEHRPVPEGEVAFSADGRWDTAAGHWKVSRGGSRVAAPTELSEGEQEVAGPTDGQAAARAADGGTDNQEEWGKSKAGRRELHAAAFAAEASMGVRGHSGKESDSPWGGRLRWNVIQ